ncbi:acetyl-CoA acetyltransferase [Beutenbergia cavernae DSM 12333]|uniref:Acetyl-CoA acetyltransferase n=1 Tax=Beutenbergia cavernae (strain ATCC BAA-8 / DSM 12333 / CCUG 43141 / JCM 11478 / NBRC 16432 / NCIMB 13614 / HKI 0122) TaxID=471853 RepID=C5C2Y3_BEUC1|nr:acetyl-CoA C-acetyltransferase [Beutenbergia cavernae]ACQ81827.1 acetyl-CoA acetyltransferase [Beutenbergia cavernae DSM 12333]
MARSTSSRTTRPTTGSVNPAPARAAVVGGNRIPFGKAGGAYASASNLDMLTAALDGLIARFTLQGVRIGDVSAGAVLKHSRDFNLTREAVLGTALDPHTPAYDVQRACATSMEAVWGLANKIALGQIDSGIAGGVDSTSDAPIVVSDRLRRTLVKLSRAKTLQQRVTLLAGLRPKDLAPVAPSVNEPRTGLSMGEHQALTAAQFGTSREAQDEIALASHHQLAAAWESGFFDDLVTPFRGLTRDEALRPDTSAEKLATLRTVFGKGEGATMTAGNSTPLSDGAATVLLASDAWAAERGLPVLAHVVDAEAAAVDFVRGGEGLLMGGAYAVPRLLARQGLTLDDFAFVEIHEAFAATVLTTIAAWEDDAETRARVGVPGPGTLDRSRLNVVGSSLAAGHPFAATGARIVATLATLLARRKAELGTDEPVRGLISVCAAGGQAVAMILEA